MNAKLESREGNVVDFSFQVEAKDFNKAIDKVYKENRKYFTVPGFRKGKAPRQIIEMNYGAEIFYEDAMNEALPEVYEAALEELDLFPVDMPSIDVGEIVKGEPIEVKVKVEVKPEVKLGDYKSITVEKVEHKVTDEVVDAEIEKIREMNARLIDASDRAVQDGDVITMDYEGFIGEEQFEGGTAEGQSLEIGSGDFIEGFEEQLVGKNVDEEVKVEVTFPEDYHGAAVAGKEAVFNVVIKDIKEKELPELDDEFVKDVSAFDTLEEYRQDFRERLEEEYAKREKLEQEAAIIRAIAEETEIDIPEGLIRSQIENEVNEFSQRLGMQGLSMDQYLQITGTQLEDLEEQVRPIAEERVKGDLILEAIGEAEGVEVTEEDRLEELRKMGEIYRPDDVDTFVENMKNNDLQFLDTVIVNRKVLEILTETVKYE